jgi:hypothetical protein
VRTLDAIYLCPAQNQQGGHELMDLNSGQSITGNIIHEIPVTNAIIKAVKNMAYMEGYKSLKFYNRNGVIYRDANWIEGVDYDEIENEDEDNDDQYYYNTKDNEEDKIIKDQLKEHEQIKLEDINDIIQDASHKTSIQKKRT